MLHTLLNAAKLDNVSVTIDTLKDEMSDRGFGLFDTYDALLNLRSEGIIGINGSFERRGDSVYSHDTDALVTLK